VALRCEKTGGKLLGGAIGGGDARGTERGGTGPLYPSQSSTGTVQWRSSGEELLSDGGVSGSIFRGRWKRRVGALMGKGLKGSGRYWGGVIAGRFRLQRERESNRGR
jgi:hypothetical protein